MIYETQGFRCKCSFTPCSLHCSFYLYMLIPDKIERSKYNNLPRELHNSIDKLELTFARQNFIVVPIIKTSYTHKQKQGNNISFLPKIKNYTCYGVKLNTRTHTHPYHMQL